MKKNKNLISAILLMIVFCLVTPFIVSKGQIFVANILDFSVESNRDNSFMENNVISNPSINNAGLHEKTSIYDYDDQDSVIYFYVSVSKGKEGTSTAHTFSEVENVVRFKNGDHFEDNVYADALVQVGDKNGPLAGSLGFNTTKANAKIRIRGNSTSLAAQKSYALELNENAGLFRGQKNIALNKHTYDISRFNNKLYFDLLRGIDNVPSLRTQFVRLFIKDETSGQTKFKDYGFFTQVEVVNRHYLGNHGLDSNGYLYKAISFNFETNAAIKNFDDPNFDLQAFESVLHCKGRQDNTKIIEMINALNDGQKSFDKFFSEYFDIDNYTTWLAYNILVRNVDTTMQNFYLYSPTNSSKWYFIPWDSDAIFQKALKVAPTMKKYNSYEYGIANYWNVLLHNKVFKNEVLVEKLSAKVDELYQYLCSGIMGEYIETYDKVVSEHTLSMPDIYYLPSLAFERENISGKYAQVLDENYSLYYTSLNAIMPFFIYDPMPTSSSFEITWEDAYDFQNQKITYTISLSKNPEMTNIIRVEKTANTHFEFTNLSKGTYYYSIKAETSDGRYVICANNIVLDDIYNEVDMVDIR